MLNSSSERRSRRPERWGGTPKAGTMPRGVVGTHGGQPGGAPQAADVCPTSIHLLRGRKQELLFPLSNAKFHGSDRLSASSLSSTNPTDPVKGERILEWFLGAAPRAHRGKSLPKQVGVR